MLFGADFFPILEDSQQCLGSVRRAFLEEKYASTPLDFSATNWAPINRCLQWAPCSALRAVAEEATTTLWASLFCCRRRGRLRAATCWRARGRLEPVRRWRNQSERQSRSRSAGPAATSGETSGTVSSRLAGADQAAAPWAPPPPPPPEAPRGSRPEAAAGWPAREHQDGPRVNFILANLNSHQLRKQLAGHLRQAGDRHKEFVLDKLCPPPANRPSPRNRYN